MRIYPAIDLKNGKCVRLVQGDFQKETIYSDNPLKIAMDFERQGCKYLHVVDLDGAIYGKSINMNVVKLILKKTQLKIELGGGIRTIAHAKRWLKAGVDRIVIGSLAITDFDVLKLLVELYGNERIVVGVDAINQNIAIHGWKTKTDINVFTFCKRLEAINVKYLIYTDISKDGMLSGPNFDEIKQLMTETKLSITASGGICNIMDVQAFSKMGVFGVIIGKAIYENAVSIKDALEWGE